LPGAHNIFELLESLLLKKSRTKSIIALVIALVLVFLAYNYFNSKKRKKSVTMPKVERTEPEFIREGTLTFLKAAGDTVKTIDIEIADTERDRMQGLMYRTKMDFDKGMLFIFDNEEEQSFWMRNTKISLDILYVNSQLEILTIYKHTQPYSDSPIPSFKPALYVVEVAAGFCDQFSVEEGDRIAFDRN
jgi:uncharacterized membrane protein (UPF0127 family)